MTVAPGTRHQVVVHWSAEVRRKVEEAGTGAPP